MVTRGAKISAEHYLALWALYHAGQRATVDEVAYYMRRETADVLKLLFALCKPRFCGGRVSWVYRCTQKDFRFSINGRKGDGDEESTDGFQALAQSIDNATLAPHLEAVWRMEALTGMRPDGQQTRITAAVLPRR
jgi:hypothetical protein